MPWLFTERSKKLTAVHAFLAAATLGLAEGALRLNPEDFRPDPQRINFTTDPQITSGINESSGNIEWRRNGLLHRDDGPALEAANGDREWYRDGLLHREDGPAVEAANGTRMWYRDGSLHRVDGPAVENANGEKSWYRNGLPHRDDGPAMEGLDGEKQWWRDGNLHRDDGPAVEYANGDKEWWRDGQLLSAAEIAAIEDRITSEKTAQPRKPLSADLPSPPPGLDNPALRP